MNAANYFNQLEFIAFVNRQAELRGARRIDHDTFETCAVGDFLEHKGESRDDAQPFAFYNFDPEFFNFLNEYGRGDYNEDKSDYKEFAEAMNELLARL